MAFKIDELDIEKRPLDEDEKNPDEIPEIASYLKDVDLTNDAKKQLIKELEDEIDCIEQEWKDRGVIDKFNALEAQYEGELDEIENLMFNVHDPMTAIKCDLLARHIRKAYNNVDPMYTASPLPETAKKMENAFEVADKQTDYVDYKLDSVIPNDSVNAKCVLEACKLGTSIKKWEYRRRIIKKTRKSVYRGKNEIAGVQGNQILFKNKELERFLQNYPDALDKYPGHVRSLEEEKTIAITANYNDIVYDDPFPTFVSIRNFRCRLNLDGYEGLKYTKLVYEKQEYTWWELKQLVREFGFDDEEVDKLKFKDKENQQVREGYEKEPYEILECVMFFNVEGKEDDDVKVKFWYHKDKKALFKVIDYPWTEIDCEYNPFYIRRDCEGFLQKGLAELLTDINLAQDALLNLMLMAVYIQTTLTPITEEGSDVDRQFLEKTWTFGLPLNARKDQIDFLSNHFEQVDINALLTVMNFISRLGDDIVGISSLMTGRESPLDPTAPATKTIALLEKSGINIEDYINAMTPSFNRDAMIILALTYQMTQEGESKEFRIKRDEMAKVVGPGAFTEISRNEMIARTNIQAQAKAFDFDKLNEKKEDLALFGLLRQEPLFAGDPMSVWTMLKHITKGWSKKWKNIFSQILPSPQEMQKKMTVASIQALGLYLKTVIENSKLTGEQPQINPKEVVKAIATLQSQIATPQPEEDGKQ